MLSARLSFAFVAFKLKDLSPLYCTLQQGRRPYPWPAAVSACVMDGSIPVHAAEGSDRAISWSIAGIYA